MKLEYPSDISQARICYEDSEGKQIAEIIFKNISLEERWDLLEKHFPDRYEAEMNKEF